MWEVFIKPGRPMTSAGLGKKEVVVQEARGVGQWDDGRATDTSGSPSCASLPPLFTDLHKDLVLWRKKKKLIYLQFSWLINSKYDACKVCFWKQWGELPCRGSRMLGSCWHLERPGHPQEASRFSTKISSVNKSEKDWWERKWQGFVC